jgi:hypothetical protein
MAFKTARMNLFYVSKKITCGKKQISNVDCLRTNGSEFPPAIPSRYRNRAKEKSFFDAPQMVKLPTQNEFIGQIVLYSILRMNYRIPGVFLQTTLEELLGKITDFTL